MSKLSKKKLLYLKKPKNAIFITIDAAKINFFPFLSFLVTEARIVPKAKLHKIEKNRTSANCTFLNDIKNNEARSKKDLAYFESRCLLKKKINSCYKW